MSERLDEEKLEQLRLWGAGLAEDRREEVRAAGRAIVLLADEVEELHVDLWNARAGVSGQASRFGNSAAVDTPVDTAVDEPAGEEIVLPLWRRLRIRRSSQVPSS